MAISSPNRRRSAVTAYVVLAVVALLFLGPLLWLLTASFDADAGLATALPKTPTTDNFSAALSWDIGGRSLVNGLLMSGGAALITTAAAVLCAYPLSRYQLRFRRSFLYIILFTTGLPVTAIMVPVYGLFVQLDLINSMTTTMLFLSAATLPMAIWMMKNFMDGVPITLEEAAWVDGASARQALMKIVLPLMAAGVAVVTVFDFIQVWGNFFVPFILLIDPDKLPASVSVFNFFGAHGLIAYGKLAAFSVAYTVPVIVLYLACSRVLGKGFRLAGGVKA